MVCAMVDYIWDEAKRLRNLKQHGLDFREAWRVHESLNREVFTTNYPDEVRLEDIAAVKGRIVSLVYTIRDGAIRCLSFRIASRQERKLYDEQREIRSLFE